MSFIPLLPPPAELFFVQSTNVLNPGTDIVVPSGVAAGDLLLFMNMCRSASSPVQPSGFTFINSQTRSDSGSTAIGAAYYKVAVGTESGTTLTGIADSSDNTIELLHFRASYPISSITVGDIESQGTSADPSAQNCQASAGAPPLVVIGHYIDGDSSGLGTTSMSPSEDGTVSSGGFVQVKYKIYNGTPEDTSVDMSDTGNYNVMQSFYLQCNL